MNFKSPSLILGLINLIGLAAVISYIFLSSSKVFYVDATQLVNGYKGMQAARSVYQKKAVTWKANIDTLTSEVKKEIFAYEKENAMMTAKERQLSQKLLRAKQKQLGDYQQAMNSQAQQEDAKMTSEVMSQVNAYLKKYGQAHGYKIILAATDYGNIAYADENLDITKEVLEGLNKEYTGQ